MDGGLAWEGIIAITALLTAVGGVYAFGTKSGKQSSRIDTMEKELRALETKLDTSLREVADRLTRMEDRLYNAMAGMQVAIRKDLVKYNTKRQSRENDNEDA